MPALRVLIAPDKFKGTLTAAEAAGAMASGWRAARPDDCLELLPITDGGDGFGEVMRELLGARRRWVQTLDSINQPCRAPWWYHAADRTAVVESARVVGLAMLPPRAPGVLSRDTFGLGRVLQAAARAGARRCVVGIGGSATNDGGFGLARALGWTFVDACGDAILQWIKLASLSKIIPPIGNPLDPMRIEVATDVRNPLLGVRGATRVFGPQKGIRRSEIPRAELALTRLAECLRGLHGRGLERGPGTGAAGGLGFGFLAFTHAKLQPGFALFSDHADLRRRLGEADLVLTGEGSLDRSSLMGKGVGEVARLCSEVGIPCIALAGTSTQTVDLRRAFSTIRTIVPEIAPAPEALRAPLRHLRALSRQAAEAVSLPRHCSPQASA